MATKHVLLSGLFCAVGASAVVASSAWKIKADSEGKRWEVEERASRLHLENKRLAEQVAAQRRSIALLRNECSIRALATAAESAQRQEDGSNTLKPSAVTEAMVELRQIGGRVEVAPGGPMSPISN